MQRLFDLWLNKLNQTNFKNPFPVGKGFFLIIIPEFINLIEKKAFTSKKVNQDMLKCNENVLKSIKSMEKTLKLV